MQNDNSNSADNSQSNWVPVDKTAECKRCGRKSLAWQQGKSGAWYLCVTRRTIHKCQPPTKNAHGLEVSDSDVGF
jgi:hypothetical protein